MVSVCDEDGNGEAWQWRVDPKTRQPIVPERERREVQLVVGDAAVKKDFFNARFDVGMLKEIGIEVRGEINEVAFMARCVDNLEMNIKLKPLAKKHCDIDDDDQKDLHAAVVKCRRIARKLGWSLAEDVEADYWLPYTLGHFHPDLLEAEGIDPDVAKTYAVRDAERTIVLSAFYRHAMDEMKLWRPYRDEMALWPITCAMEEVGVTVDPVAIERCAEACRQKIKVAHAAVVKAYGKKDFNVNSPKQVVELLFGGRPLRLPVLHRTPTDQPETGGEALLPHISNPLVQHLLSYRANTKALSTFFEKYKKLARKEDRGLVLHPGFKQDGTLSWRYSCSEPNLQAVSNPDTTSSRTAQFVVDVRQVFVPSPGTVWYCPDYSQVEVIIFADIAKEPTMLQAIRDGVDIHEATLERIWGGEGNPKTLPRTEMMLADPAAVTLAGAALEVNPRKKTVSWLARGLVELHEWRLSQVEKELGKKIHRKLAKSATFTKIFGGGPLALMSWIGVSYDEAKQILGEYESAFPKMMESMAEIEAEGLENGYITTAFGHRLRVDRWYAYRAVNHKVQGSAAGLMKRGMRGVAAYFKETDLAARIAMTIHDELILEFRKDHAFKRALRRVCEIMSDHGGAFSVPTPVDIERVTERWSKKEAVAI